LLAGCLHETHINNCCAEVPNHFSIQCKLSFGAVDDPLEDEADAMADKVMRMPEQNFIQRKCAHCEEEEKMQRKPLGAFIQKKSVTNNTVASDTISNQIQWTKNSGNTMSGTTKSFMESRFRTSFSNVNIHTGSHAAQMSNELNAKAFTVDNNIYFNEGEYAPETFAGKHLLAHELTHIIQQDEATQENTQMVQRAFSPWPGQTGTDVAGTYSSSNGIIRERVQRTGDPNYTQPMPSLLEFNPATCSLKSTMEINFIQETDAANKLTTTQFTALKQKILQVGNSRLNGWIYIKTGNQSPCPAGCKDKNISVEILATEGTGSNAAKVALGKKYARENAGHIGEGSSDWTIWHEMGHIVLGAPDEYADTGRPDERVNESDYSIMASSNTFGRLGMLHSRHFSHLAAWLTRKFPGCTFDIAETSRPVIIDWNPSFFIGGFGGQSSGLFYSAGIEIGIPLERMRRLSLILGPRLLFTLESPTYSQQRMALLAGFRAGLRYKTLGSFGFHSSIFAEGGGAGFTNLASGTLGLAPYAEGGVSAGLRWGGFNLSLEGALGGRTAPVAGITPDAPLGTQFQEYFRFGLSIGGTF